MPITLTTFASGAVIDATVLRDRLQTIEKYVNEQLVAGDRGSTWLDANHVYRADFFGGANPHTTLVSGETYYRQKGPGDAERAFFSWFLNNTTGWVQVPWLNVTFQLPEQLDQGTRDYRVEAFTSFYAYEFGGDDADLDLSSDNAATFSLMLDGDELSGINRRPLYKGSKTGTQQLVALYPRSQVSMAHAFTSSDLTPGVHNVGVVVQSNAPGVTTKWKHIIVRQGAFILRYGLR
jgi:hypothetical protein